MGGFAAFEKKKKLIYSMLTLAGLLGVSIGLTTAATSYFRGQDPVNQCITDPMEQPFQLSVPIEVFEDGIRSTVRNVGVSENCIRPVHTLTDNEIHVAYERPYDFTIGHFFYYWLGNDILRYDTDVYVNGQLHREGDFRDIVLRQGDIIRINLTTRNQ
jgi:hypothetical protein